MSYRTYVNGIEFFGNNQWYKEWDEFLISEGIKINDDGSYEGEITNVMGAIETIERIIIRLEIERRTKINEFNETLKKSKNPDKFCVNEFIPTSLFDLRKSFDDFMDEEAKYPDDNYNTSLTDRMLELRKNAYIFLPCLFLDACKDVIEKDKSFIVPKHFKCFKIKEGCTIKVRAS